MEVIERQVDSLGFTQMLDPIRMSDFFRRRHGILQEILIRFVTLADRLSGSSERPDSQNMMNGVTTDRGWYQKMDQM